MTRRAWVEHHMGMPMSIHLRGDDLARPEVEKAVATAYGRMGAPGATTKAQWWLPAARAQG